MWKFRTFEEPSLHYGHGGATSHTQGGWTLTRDPHFARLISVGVLTVGQELTADGVSATVTDDYGISLDGIRYDSPDAAAAATVGTVADGWSYWTAESEYGTGTLAELTQLEPAPT